MYYLGGAAPAGHSAGVTRTGDARVVAPRAARRWVAQVALLGARRRADTEASKQERTALRIGNEGPFARTLCGEVSF